MTSTPEETVAPKKKNPIVPLAVVALAAGGFYVYQDQSGGDSGESSAFCTQAEVVEAQFAAADQEAMLAPDIDDYSDEQDFVWDYADWMFDLSWEIDSATLELSFLANRTNNSDIEQSIGEWAGLIEETSDLISDAGIAYDFDDLNTELGELNAWYQSDAYDERERLQDEVATYVREQCDIEFRPQGSPSETPQFPVFSVADVGGVDVDVDGGEGSIDFSDKTEEEILFCAAGLQYGVQFAAFSTTSSSGPAPAADDSFDAKLTALQNWTNLLLTAGEGMSGFLHEMADRSPDAQVTSDLGVVISVLDDDYLPALRGLATAESESDVLAWFEELETALDATDDAEVAASVAAIDAYLTASCGYGFYF